MEIKGYKAFNEDFTNRYNRVFKEDKSYHTDGEISFGLNGKGFHFCKRLEDTLRYFDTFENSIVIDIINREQTNPFTRKELLEHIFNNYEIVLTKGWLNLFLQRQKDKIKAYCARRGFKITDIEKAIKRRKENVE